VFLVHKLLLKIPELKPFHKGREVLLVFEKDVGPALVSACDYTDAMYFAKASEIVRREIFAEQNKLSGHFDRRVLLNFELVSNCLSLDSYKLHRSASLNTTHPVLPRCVSTT
jgi:hypothetical protein